MENKDGKLPKDFKTKFDRKESFHSYFVVYVVKFL
jgi:hypothetical protein